MLPERPRESRSLSCARSAIRLSTCLCNFFSSASVLFFSSLSQSFTFSACTLAFCSIRGRDFLRSLFSVFHFFAFVHKAEANFFPCESFCRVFWRFLLRQKEKKNKTSWLINFIREKRRFSAAAHGQNQEKNNWAMISDCVIERGKSPCSVVWSMLSVIRARSFCWGFMDCVTIRRKEEDNEKGNENLMQR